MTLNKSKDHSPVRSNSDCAETAQFPFQRVKIEAREIHILNRTGGIKARQDIAQLGQMLPRDGTGIIVLIEALQSLVAKGSNHEQV